MSATREELRRLLKSLPEERLDEVRDLMVVLTKEPEDLTTEELRTGDWVWWRDIKRKDV
jgi:hypothetical protein